MRIEDGKVFEVPIEKDYVDKEGGRRFLGFRSLIERFQHKVQGNHARQLADDDDSIFSYPTWTSPSTQKQRVEYSFLGSMCDIPASFRNKTRLVRTCHPVFDPIVIQ